MQINEQEASIFKRIVLAVFILFGGFLVYQAVVKTGGCAPLGRFLSYSQGIGWGGAGGTGGLQPRAGDGDNSSAGRGFYEGGGSQQGYAGGGIQGMGWRTGSGG